MKFKDLDLTKKGVYSSISCHRNLKKLRSEIVLNSIYYSDYENSFGIDSRICRAFFDGFISFITELEQEKYGKNSNLPNKQFLDEFDTLDNLIEWYYCHDEFGDE